MFYPVKTPRWVMKLFPESTWSLPGGEKNLYLTFDDGPHPEVTPFVLDELNRHHAKATFFCIGRNVIENPSIYRQILDNGHAVGNHTYNHLNGWKTKKADYIENVLKARESIESDLFRPPYGRITRSQHKELTGLKKPFRIVMWSVLSGDFDIALSTEKCYSNVVDNVKNGSVIVFHDSEKAKEKIFKVLPAMLKHFSDLGYAFKKIE